MLFKNIKENYNLSTNSWFGTGGDAKKYFNPENKKELINYLKTHNEDDYLAIGSGSNTLFRDKGCKNTIIKLGKGFREIILSENEIICGAGSIKKNLSEFALQNSIEGFEFLSCIPGTIGGGVVMNAGCFGYEFKDIIKQVHCISHDGVEKIYSKSDIDFSYRKTSLPRKMIIIKITCSIKLGEKESIQKKINDFKSQKSLNQPSKIKTGGSTFKNPGNGIKAWELIKKSGCNNIKFGKAKFSEHHCNFIENSGNSSMDIEKLIDHTINKVKDDFGITLEPEIKIFGEK